MNFWTDPMASVSKAYDELGLRKSETALASMRAFLESRPKGGYAAAHSYAKADENTMAEERKTILATRNTLEFPTNADLPGSSQNL
jgi:hypothetical protein